MKKLTFHDHFPLGSIPVPYDPFPLTVLLTVSVRVCRALCFLLFHIHRTLYSRFILIAQARGDIQRCAFAFRYRQLPGRN